MPLETGRTEKPDIKKIYPESELTFDNMVKRPILKPMLDINNTVYNLDLTILNAVYEYENDEKVVNDMLARVPKYSETTFVNRIMKMLREMREIIRCEDLIIAVLKKAIGDMVDINNSKYEVIKTEKKEEFPIPIQQEFKAEPSEPTSFKSSLLERELPMPEKEIKKKKGEIRPLGLRSQK